MKVGILLLNNADTGMEGGGFTFKSEILQSLIEFSSKSNHTFVLFGFENPVKESSIQFIPLQRSFRERLISKAKTLTNLKKLGDTTNKQKEDTFIKFIYEKIYENEVEMIWYLTPFSCPIMELPYITVVWDLQHRLQPYFPEVTTEGEWDWREDTFNKILKRATVVISGSETGKAEIERFYQVPKENIKLLPLPTPIFALNALPNESEQVIDKYNIQSNYLFYPAQFWSHKNHVGLLLAVQLLRDKYDLIFSVVFVGSDKGNQPYIKEVVDKLNLTPQVHFLGFVSQQDLISLYRNAFALTFLSFFGPDNLPPLEAFALGCPVIAANVSGVEEQLGDAALLVNPKDPQQISDAIKSLYDRQDLYQTLIKRGLERAYKWTGQDYVKGMFSILDELEPIRRCWSSKEPLGQR